MALQKRPLPAPIFNKGKRPRVALVAHPNNQGGISHEAIQSKDKYQYDRSFNSPFQEQHSFTRQPLQQNPSNSSYYQQQFNKENSRGSFTHTGIQQKSHDQAQRYETQEGSSASQWRTAGGHSYGVHGKQRSSSWQKGRGSKLTNQKLTNQFSQREDQVAVGAAVAIAKEPSKAASVRVKKPHPDGVRVITATAQGVQHWSQCREPTRLLFEVYGTLASVAVSRQHQAEQEFSIRTVDGVLQCVYWEMETKFPLLAHGKQIRVVGGWDTDNKKLKCYSVRPSRAGEEERMVQQCVALADRHMRRFVAKTKMQ